MGKNIWIWTKPGCAGHGLGAYDQDKVFRVLDPAPYYTPDMYWLDKESNSTCLSSIPSVRKDGVHSASQAQFEAHIRKEAELKGFTPGVEVMGWLPSNPSVWGKLGSQPFIFTNDQCLIGFNATAGSFIIYNASINEWAKIASEKKEEKITVIKSGNWIKILPSAVGRGVGTNAIDQVLYVKEIAKSGGNCLILDSSSNSRYDSQYISNPRVYPEDVQLMWKEMIEDHIIKEAKLRGFVPGAEVMSWNEVFPREVWGKLSRERFEFTSDYSLIGYGGEHNSQFIIYNGPANQWAKLSKEMEAKFKTGDKVKIPKVKSTGLMSHREFMEWFHTNVPNLDYGVITEVDLKSRVQVNFDGKKVFSFKLSDLELYEDKIHTIVFDLSGSERNNSFKYDQQKTSSYKERYADLNNVTSDFKSIPLLDNKIESNKDFETLLTIK